MKWSTLLLLNYYYSISVVIAIRLAELKISLRTDRQTNPDFIQFRLPYLELFPVYTETERQTGQFYYTQGNNEIRRQAMGK